MTGGLEEIFGLVVGIVSIAKDLGHPSDVLLASLCVHGHSISRFRFSCMRTKKYAFQGTYPREKRGEGPLYFALSGSRAVLPPPGPLRTVRAPLNAHRSSPRCPKAARRIHPCSCSALRMPLGPFDDEHRLTSPKVEAAHGLLPGRTSRKWAPFRGRH